MKILRDGSQIQASDVAHVCLDPTVGAEMRKTRPCVVIEAGGSPLELAIVLPITDGAFKSSKIFVQIDDLKSAGLMKPSAVDCYQLRAVALERISPRIGALSKQVMFEVRRRLSFFLDIGEEHCAQ